MGFKRILAEKRVFSGRDDVTSPAPAVPPAISSKPSA